MVIIVRHVHICITFCTILGIILQLSLCFTAFIFYSSLFLYFCLSFFKGLLVTSLSQKEYWDGHVHSAIFKIDKQQDPTL